MRPRIVLLMALALSQGVLASSNVTSRNADQEKALLSFHLEPAQPKVGDKVSVFIQAESSLSKNEYVLESTLDAANLKLTATGALLWSGNLKTYSEVKSHSIEVNVYVRDTLQASRLKSGISTLKKEITALDEAILAETDPNKIVALEAERNGKQAYQDELETNLENLKVFLKTESFGFNVQADPNSTVFPFITAVSPNASPLAKRIRVTIAGNNFPANPVVKFGGQNSTIISATASSIEVLAPNFSVAGTKNIEITFPATETEPKKNAVLENSFMASDRAILKNLRPVAVTTGYLKVTWPPTAPAVLTGTNSYDENGDAFSYDWTFQKAPAGSVFVSGTTLDNSATPSFTPDKVGIYTIRLRLSETNTEELLNSYYSTVTVEVK